MNIKENITLYDLLTEYPESVKYLESKNIKNIVSGENFEKFGKTITLGQILKTKKINSTDFIEELQNYLSSDDTDITLRGAGGKKKKSVVGVLPCPIRIPLLEAVDEFIQSDEEVRDNVSFELKAASAGVDWMLDDLKEIETSADMYMLAGFDFFFGENFINKYKKNNVFKDTTGVNKYNKAFDNANASLKDPNNFYAIVGVVPAIFLVNKKELGNDEPPRSWEELLSGRFENRISMPITDLDLFNAIVLTIYKNFGFEGVLRLKKAVRQSMHPSEMVKSDRKMNAPVVTIMPYFFTIMARSNPNMMSIWPEDGAITSPIFMVSKEDTIINKVSKFFASEKIGRIFSNDGAFPSTNPDVDNKLEDNQNFMWVGWDFLNNEPISEILAKCYEVFEK